MHRLVSGGRRPTLLVGRRLLRLSQQRSVSIPAAATLANGRGRVAVAMSGGIDSAVTAVLLQEAGYDCVGVFMKNWDDADESASGSKCDSSEDLKDMQEVCQRLGIPAYNVDFMKEYWNDVFVPFIDAYKTGISTPNPDVFCNRFVKFQHFRRYVADHLGISTIATGHYCRLDRERGSSEEAPGCAAGARNSIDGAAQGEQSTRGEVRLLRGVDPLKDQSYFLCLTQGNSLRDVLFPVGHLQKSAVKALAAERLRGLRVLQKKESMGICFIGKRPMHGFLAEYLDMTPGRYIDLDDGQVLGQHRGRESLTLGQKARISGCSTKYFIAAKSLPENSQRVFPAIAVADAQDGDVFVVRDAEHPALFRASISLPLSSVNWIAGSPPEQLLSTVGAVGASGAAVFRCECKCRYAQKPVGCSLHMVATPLSSSETERSPRGLSSTLNHTLVVTVTFDEPQRAVTPGQILALYDGDVCLGGAVIE
ncbi:tRNA-specific 2-thiouridylase [Ochromonadaceae sp. CCMP2298]|nr:tRNA-specific 2-thiouridylase [Ochromonadaceae sp. CCMP2298]